MNEEEKKILEEMLEQMPPNIRQAFDDAAGASGMPRDDFIEGILEQIGEDDQPLSPEDEEFLRAVFVGDCPDCASGKTLSGDEIEQIDDPTVGYCEDCGLLWCLECGMYIDAGSVCGHWDVCDECPEEKDEFNECGLPPSECPTILEWHASVAAGRLKSVCAWCGGAMPEGNEVFGTGAKIREGIDFVQGSSPEGFLMEVTIAGRRVPTIVTGKDSEARRQGNDLMFMTCSVKCAEELKVALERERDIIEKTQLN
ncbi:MAG: hypothetical protein ACYC99_03555 [Candidatus Geothermincolia bacterium]